MHAPRIAQTDLRRGWWLLLASVVLLALSALAGAEEKIVGIEHRVRREALWRNVITTLGYTGTP